MGGEGGWDYLTVDSESRRLYVSRSNRAVITDLDKETVVDELVDTLGIHGIALQKWRASCSWLLGRGFVSTSGEFVAMEVRHEWTQMYQRDERPSD